MDIIARFPAGDTETKELFEQWKSMGASIEIGSEKRWVGGAELTSAISALTPLVSYLIGRYFDYLKKRKIVIEYAGGKILAEGYNEEKLIELLREPISKDS